jgi:gas vesicle protein
MSNTLKYTGIALAGGAVGAALGLLFAPASGDETRRQIAHRIDEQREALSARSQAVTQSIKEGRRRLAAVVNG